MPSQNSVTELALFEAVFQNNLIGISIAENLNIIKVNNAFCKMLGYTPKEFKKKNILDISIPNQNDHSASLIKKLVAKEIEYFTVVKQYRHKSGKFIYVETNVSGVYDNNDQYLMSVAMHQNISDKVSSERHLRSSESLIRGLFENSPLGIIVNTIKNNNLSNVNSGFCELIGYSRDELQHMSIADITYSADLKKHLPFIEKLKTNEINSFVMEKRYIHKSGKLVWATTKVATVRNAQNELLYDFAIIEDITERKKSERKLIQSNNKLKKINKELDHFVYRASHDLKSPLASILGLINVARIDKSTDPFDTLDIIESQIHRLEFFIEDIIDYSKISRVGNIYSIIDFSKLLNEAIKDNEYLKGFDSITTSVSIEGKVELHTDVSKLMIIFNNLISNAIKYSDHRKSDSYLRVKVKKLRKEATIEIEDNGIGVKEEYLGNLFTMFYRATDKGSGSGLGLFIVKEALDNIGGEISVSSEFGKGTSITLKIPNKK